MTNIVLTNTRNIEGGLTKLRQNAPQGNSVLWVDEGDHGDRLMATRCQDGQATAIYSPVGKNIMDYDVSKADASAPISRDSIVVAECDREACNCDAVELVVIDPQGNVRPLLQDHKMPIGELAISPQGDAIAYVDSNDEGEVYYQDLKSASPCQLSDSDAEGSDNDDLVEHQNLQFTPDGKSVLYNCLLTSWFPLEPEYPELWVADIQGGSRRRLLGEDQDYSGGGIKQIGG